MDIALTTELDAVNTMLSAIAEAPITSLDDDLAPDAATARNILWEVARAVQSKGWVFNSEYEYELSPDINGNINLPANTLRADTSNVQGYVDVVQRGLRLYDRQNKTYVFTTPLKLNLVLLFDWTDMPEPMRRYITIRAARVLCDRTGRSNDLHRFTMDDEIQALAVLEEAESDNADLNMLWSDPVQGPLQAVRYR